jgi:hypothetical protein
MAAQAGDLQSGHAVPETDLVLAVALGRDPLAVRADRQSEDPALVDPQLGSLRARGRVVDADPAIQADDEPPAIRREQRGEAPRLPAEVDDGPARLGVPEATGLGIHRARISQMDP